MFFKVFFVHYPPSAVLQESNIVRFFKSNQGKGSIKNLVIPATRITAGVSVVSSQLSVRTRAAFSQTTGSKLKKKENSNSITSKRYHIRDKAI